ncbi:MAG: MBL fold metallo-hydrolase [Desulfobacterales bacterium]|nr:MBL fold metallo-hydrolase [Desulfobacterales bacterium]
MGSLEFHRSPASPGHSSGGICLYREGLVITGDPAPSFAGSIGGTDFHGGRHEPHRAVLPEARGAAGGHPRPLGPWAGDDHRPRKEVPTCSRHSSSGKGKQPQNSH